MSASCVAKPATYSPLSNQKSSGYDRRRLFWQGVGAIVIRDRRQVQGLGRDRDRANPGFTV